MVDTLGRIWVAKVHAASQHDSISGLKLIDMSEDAMLRLKKVMGDKSYRGTFAEAVEKLDIAFEAPERGIGTKGFVVETKRWVVERTFAWLNFLAKNHSQF